MGGAWVGWGWGVGGVGGGEQGEKSVANDFHDQPGWGWGGAWVGWGWRWGGVGVGRGWGRREKVLISLEAMERKLGVCECVCVGGEKGLMHNIKSGQSGAVEVKAVLGAGRGAVSRRRKGEGGCARGRG